MNNVISTFSILPLFLLACNLNRIDKSQMWQINKSLLFQNKKIYTKFALKTILFLFLHIENEYLHVYVTDKTTERFISVCKWIERKNINENKNISKIEKTIKKLSRIKQNSHNEIKEEEGECLCWIFKNY